MNAIREYIISIAAAALLCGILTRLTRGSASGEFVKMVCGVFLTVVLIQPMTGKKTLVWDTVLPNIVKTANAVTMEGIAAAENMKTELITQRLESYILSRAEAMETKIQVCISLGEDAIPIGVHISGDVSPMNRSRLTQIIASELGIPKERQEWNG